MKTKLHSILGLLALLAGIHKAAAQGTTVYPVATNGSITQYSGGLATDGTNYLFVFSSGTTNCAQLVSSNGTLIGSPIVLSGGAAGMPPQLLVISGQTNYLVVWSDSSISSGVDIFGKFISRSGAIVGSKFPLLQSVGSHGFQGIESLACDGTNFLVVWQDEKGFTGGSSPNASFGQLVTPSGALSGSEFQVANVAWPLQAQGLAVAFGRTNYLAAWQSGSSGTTYATYGAFISPGGVEGSQFTISQTNSAGNNPDSVGFDGTNYLVTWNFATNGIDPIDWRLHGRLVSPKGNFPGNELALANESTLICSLAFDGANYLLAWGYHTDTTNTDKNIHFRFFDRTINPIGPQFNVFSIQGTNAPLVPGLWNGVVFDGKRFAIAAILGTVTIGTDGQFQGVPSAQVYGAFIPASTTPPQFSAGASYASKQFTLSLAGTPGINYAIQMATNLVAASWTSLVTNSPTNGTFTFTDPGATNRSRFYRAVKQ